MKHQLLQLFTVRERSLFRSILHRLGLAIIVSVLSLSTGELLLPLRAMAQPTAFTNVSSIVGNQTIFAKQPITSATSRMSAIVVNRLRQDLSKRTKIPPTKLKLVEATPKTWSNGCFGLAQPDEVCTQALIEGWRVVFSNGSQRWVYRTDKQGRGYRLES